MKHCYTVSLRLWIPLLLFLVFSSIWALFARQQFLAMRAGVIEASLRFVTQDLRSLQREMNNYLRDGNALRAEQSLTARGVDTRYSALAAMDNHAWILYSLHFNQKHSQATSVFNHFSPHRFHQTRDRSRTSIAFEPESNHITAYLPLKTGITKPNPRFPQTGALYARYDLNSEFSQIWSNFWDSSISLSLAILVAMFTTGAFMHYLANRPIQFLAKAANEIAAGNSVTTDMIHGQGELVHLAKAFNHMSTQLNIREQQLKSSERLYRTLVEDQTEAVVRLRPDGTIVFANSTFQSLTQKTNGSFLDQDFIDVIQFQEPGRLTERMKELSPASSVIRWEQERKTPEGWQVITWILHGIYDPEGKLSDIIATGRDTTEQKLVTEGFRRVIEASPVALIITDRSGRIVQTNQSAEDTFGHTQAAMIGQEIEFLIPQRFHNAHVKERTEYTEHPIGRKMGSRRELSALHQSGREFPIELALKPVTLGEQQMIIAVVMDISERKRAEEERQKLEAQLRHQQKLESIGTLAGGVAHEINNPINGIMNYAQLITDQLEETNPLREYSQEITHETERVAKIVKNLLSFARQEEEALKSQSIQEIIDNTMALIRTILRKDHIQLSVFIEENLPTVQGRGQQLQQVLMNLLTNARDALNTRYPQADPKKTMTIRAMRRPNMKPDTVRVTVEDHGDGIDPKVRDRIFDPFFTTKDRTKGTGLGLSISHGIIESHNGTLTVESKMNEYTRFHVDLPIFQPSDPEFD